MTTQGCNLPTDVISMTGSERTPLPGANQVGPADPQEHMTLRLILRRNPTSDLATHLERLTQAHPAQRQHLHLSRAEFTARHGANPADVDLVKSFAAAHQLNVDDVNLAARTIILSGTVAAVNSAFHVNLSTYAHPEFTYRGHTGPVHIPSRLFGVIVAVLGLDNRPQARPHFRIYNVPAEEAHSRGATPPQKASQTPRASTSISYTPPQVAALYDFPSAVDCTDQCIGIIELGGGYSQQNLATYFSNLGLPAPTVTSVSVDGGRNQPTGNANGPDGEVDLDIEVAASIALGVRTVVYFAPNTDAGFLGAITTAIHDTTNKPSVLSISWGGPESSWTGQAMQAMNKALEDAAALGVTVCVASGDNGSTDNVQDGLAHVDFPASSPYALACGGTRLTAGSTSMTSETVWNDGPNGGASGGGVSDEFPLPSWQEGAGVPPSANPGGHIGRGVPDVSGDADPATGYQVLVDGQSFAIGGTSAVAPLWAALIAIANHQLGHAVGYINPTLYGLGASANAFRDITTGNNDIGGAPNGAYQAKAGWDACTGLGSPHGQALITALTQP